jgi:hypothetical protein
VCSTHLRRWTCPTEERSDVVKLSFLWGRVPWRSGALRNNHRLRRRRRVHLLKRLLRHSKFTALMSAVSACGQQTVVTQDYEGSGQPVLVEVMLPQQCYTLFDTSWLRFTSISPFSPLYSRETPQTLFLPVLFVTIHIIFWGYRRDPTHDLLNCQTDLP